MASAHTTTDLDELLTALEERVRRATRVVQRLRAENARLAREIESAHASAADWRQRCTAWERERDALQARLERLLSDLDHLTLPPHDEPGTESPHERSDRDG